MSAPFPRPVAGAADEDARTTLTRLLADTVAKAAFTPEYPESSTSLRADEYRQLVSFESNTPEHSRRFSLPRFRVQFGSNLKTLSNYLHALFAPKEYFDTERQEIDFVSLFPSGPFHLTDLCSKLVTSAILHTPAVTADVLCSFLEEDSFPLSEVHILLGSQVDAPIRLDNWATIQPYSYIQPLLSAHFLPDSKPPIDSNTVACALVLQARGCIERICGPEQLARLVRYTGVAGVGPQALVSLITVTCQQPLQTLASTFVTDQTIVDTLPVMTDRPRGGWALLNLDTSTRPTKRVVSFVNREDLTTLVDSYSKLDPNTLRQLRIPLSRFLSALSRRDYEDKCIDLAIAFEALLVDSDQNIKKKLVKRSAWLYAENDAERTRIRKRMENFYGHRSEMVHGKSVRESPELMHDAVSVFVVCVRNILKQGRTPAWGSVDLDSTLGNQLLDELDTLSEKHDPMSWTVRQEQSIDDALTSVWRPTLPYGQRGDRQEAVGTHYTYNTEETTQELSAKGSPYVVVDPQSLENAHPYWTDDFSKCSEAHGRRCSNDVDAHTFLWLEAAQMMGVTPILHLEEEKRRDRAIYALASGRVRRISERSGDPQIEALVAGMGQ